ncbi:MAG: restriction endonuclease [Oceanicaulis sp.]|jgi:hypothetical protein|nr:restriction endonuclease [Oceanicaulis sp.]
MNEPIAFYCRAKPQQADAWPIFRDQQRVFIGYPMVRHGAHYYADNLAQCLVSPACGDEEWAEQISGRAHIRQFSGNRNLVAEVTPGSIVVVPRPESGLAHLARIAGPFKIENDPPWLKTYMALREAQGAYLDEPGNQHAADVAQGWPVETWISVPLAALPGWIRRSLFGRSTYGRLHHHPFDETETAHDALNRLLAAPGRAVMRSPTADLGEIKKRIADTLTASAFEHLMVNLMQLENPEEVWMHTGGPGDGGVDGMAVGADGRTAAIIQCKLYGSQEAWPKPEDAARGMRRVFAVLCDWGGEPPDDGVDRLGADRIAQLVLKHAAALPEARSMKIVAP